MKASSSITAVLVGSALLILTSACGSDADDKATASSSSTQGLVTAICNQLQKCDAVNLQILFGDVSTCVSATTASIDLSLPGLDYTNGKVSACADAINAASCETGFDDLAACRFPGTLANGAGCSESNQCLTGYCQVGDATGTTTNDCGKCAPVPADGAACTDDEDGCNVGSECDPTKKVCTPRPGSGAACSDSGVSCQPGFRCIANVCSAPLADGAACDDSEDTCGITSVCLNSKCTEASSLITVADIGQPCGLDATSMKEIACKFGSCVAQKCVAYATAGQACTDDDSPGATITNPACAPNLDCTNGTCVKELSPSCQ